ncbi:MAG: MBL fold metallo-hydrolase [Anaerolineae bacterium]|jgi:L-ascorbate metabolism protein UlaG (beta-lactamase superfamily)|nr:MBL fold metallo-hydrolase [Anaerolineae bacterium]MBT7069354.1 MBL fold metallo-hydrolase [Anaerolineae bacterium]MBT7326536.1 MBL fold metallo-hydrolase [Anaerolineae bacterium]MBT7599743.1 MBL fold metallo-hydrolase [Anaerolineae bacterium]
MEITWYGHSCFRLTERGLASVVTDPFDHEVVGYKALKLKANIITVSHDAPGHSFSSAVKGYSHLLNGPGEYEIGEVFITGARTNGRKEEDQSRNTLYVFDYNGITIAHLGDLRAVPTRSQVDALGSVNVVLIPVGGGGGLSAAKAAEVVSVLEPNIVIPMHYAMPNGKLPLDPLEKFIKEMGLGTIEPENMLKVTKGNLPEETRVVVLNYQS